MVRNGLRWSAAGIGLVLSGLCAAPVAAGAQALTAPVLTATRTGALVNTRWTAVDGATSYKVEWDVRAEFTRSKSDFIGMGRWNAPTLAATVVAPCVDVYYRVLAEAGKTRSAWSNVVRASCPCKVPAPSDFVIKQSSKKCADGVELSWKPVTTLCDGSELRFNSNFIDVEQNGQTVSEATTAWSLHLPSSTQASVKPTHGVTATYSVRQAINNTGYPAAAVKKHTCYDVTLLKSVKTGKHLTAALNRAKCVVEGAATAGDWERFAVLENADGTFSFLSLANNLYVTTAESNGQLQAKSATIAGPAQKFRRVGKSPNWSFISVSNGKYVSVDGTQGNFVLANHPAERALGDRQRFTLE